MATLSNGDRAALHARLMADASADRTPLALTKAQLRAAIDGADDWVDSSAASFNTAIPQPARGILTARQKAELLMYVVRRRWEIT